MKKAEDIHFLKERANAVAGAAAYNRLLTLVARMSSKTISIGRNNNGGLNLEVIRTQGGGGDIEITSSDASITVTPTNSGYDLKSAVTVVAGTNITVSRSGNTFTVSAPNMVTALSVRNVYTLQPGSQAWAEISGSGASRVLDLGIPQGAKGDMGYTGIAVGTVSTLAAGSSATANIRGSVPYLILDLGIPKGDKGDSGDAGAIEGASPVDVDFDAGTATVALNGLDTQSSGIVVISNGTFTPLPLPSANSILTFSDGHLAWKEYGPCQ